MSNQIFVFTLNGCSHCVNLKNTLKKHKIEFTEIEISNNGKLWDKVVEQTGHNVLPTVFVKLDDKDDGPVYIPGKDFQNSDDLVLKIKKYV